MEEEWITPLKAAKIIAKKYPNDYSRHFELALLAQMLEIKIPVKGILEGVIGFNGASVPSELLSLRGQKFIIENFLKIAAQYGIPTENYRTRILCDNRAVAFSVSGNTPEFIFTDAFIPFERITDIESRELKEGLFPYKTNNFDLNLNYDEAINFILFKDRMNLNRADVPEAHKKTARSFLINSLSLGMLCFENEDSEGNYIFVYGWQQIGLKMQGEYYAGFVSYEAREGNIAIKCDERGFFVAILHYDGTCGVFPKIWRYEDLTYSANSIEGLLKEPLIDLIVKRTELSATEPTAESIEKPMTQQERGRKGGRPKSTALYHFVEQYRKDNKDADFVTFLKYCKTLRKQTNTGALKANDIYYVPKEKKLYAGISGLGERQLGRIFKDSTPE